MSAIRVENLTRQFPGEARPAVDRASFTVAEHTVVELLGPSGCGKTTLLIGRVAFDDLRRIVHAESAIPVNE